MGANSAAGDVHKGSKAKLTIKPTRTPQPATTCASAAHLTLPRISITPEFPPSREAADPEQRELSLLASRVG